MEFDAAQAILVMEYMPKGTLGTWLHKFNRLGMGGKPYGTRPPNIILWSIFHCLLRSCIAMAFPLEPRSDPDPGPDPGTVQISQRAERVPIGNRREMASTDPLVHFNLKPSNGNTALSPSYEGDTTLT